MQHISELVRDLAAFCHARGAAAWLVGGAVRDVLLGRPLTDLDVAVAGDGLALARAFARARRGAFVPLDHATGTGRAVLPGGMVVDLVSLRAADILGDLALRDFTLNAMALPLAPEALAAPPAGLIDPLGGAADLAARRLRACGPTSLADDPLRILRGARLAATLGLSLDGALPPLMAAAAPALAGVAAERISDELLKLLSQPAAAPWLRALDEAGALTTIIPELEPARACQQPGGHFLPVLAHSLETVAAVEWLVACLAGAAEAVPPPVAVATRPELARELPYGPQLAALMAERRGGGHPRAALLKLAALLHDNAKPQTKAVAPDGGVTFYGHQELGAEVAAQIVRRLRLARADGAYVVTVVGEHMRPGQLRTAETLTARAVVRLFRDTAGAGPDVLLHELADHLASRGPRVSPEGWAAHLAWVGELLRAHFEPPPGPRAPLLRGGELMAELALGPGPEVGRLLREIEEARAAGEIADRAEALALARRLSGR